MDKKICDRCGEEIEGTTYYTVDIYGHDINPTHDGRFSAHTFGQNLAENTRKMVMPEQCYCNHCKSEIEIFIRYPNIKKPEAILDNTGVNLHWYQKFWFGGTK